SEWTKLLAAIQPQLGNLELTDVVEDDNHQDITFLSREIGRPKEDIMRVVVSARLEAAYAHIAAAVFWAFLRQRLPAALPSPVLDSSQGFPLIESLVQRVAALILSLSSDLQTRTLTAAVAQQLIAPKFGGQIAEIVAELQAQRSTDALQQPYLIGKA